MIVAPARMANGHQATGSPVIRSARRLSTDMTGGAVTMRRLARRALSATAAVATAVAVTALAPWTPSVAAATCVEAGPAEPEVPWSQRVLAPERAWPFSRGAGVTVAILGSGVEGDHPQLGDQVRDGFNPLGAGAATVDCLGTGTQVAGVIAGQPADGTGFVGLAPRARIMPVKVVDDQSTTGLVAGPADLAAGIDAAVDSGAQVIAVTVVTYTGSVQLESAVARAVAEGITMVAAVGDEGHEDQENRIPYPAAYDDVIGVGAIDETGRRWSNSQHGEYVDLMAPGVDIVTLQPGGGMTRATGTAIACGFVAATAALVRSRWGEDLAGRDVPDQLIGTATPAATGLYYGHGVINPYAAVTNRIVDGPPADLPRPSSPAGPAGVDDSLRTLALTGAGLALLATVVAILVALAVPRGRRRRWRGTLAPRTTALPESAEPGPPVSLFDETGARAR
jgi:type VII secretion-associated serine protease mycosin